MITQAYVYKWTHLPTLRWYVGSRYKEGCHPNDGYVCSSRIIKPMIEEFPNEWVKTIIAIGTPEEMYNLETEILQTTDAKNDPRSFNQHNNEGFGPVWKGGIKGNNYLQGYHWINDGNQEKLVDKNDVIPVNFTKGRLPFTEKFCKAISAARKNKPKSEEHKIAMRKAAKGKQGTTNGRIRITNGIDEAVIHKNSIIPDGWYKGRTIKVKGKRHG